MRASTTWQLHYLTSTVFGALWHIDSLRLRNILTYLLTYLRVSTLQFASVAIDLELHAAESNITHQRAVAAVQSQCHATLVSDHCDAVASISSTNSRRPVQSEVICDADGEITWLLSPLKWHPVCILLGSVTQSCGINL